LPCGCCGLCLDSLQIAQVLLVAPSCCLALLLYVENRRFLSGIVALVHLCNASVSIAHPCDERTDDGFRYIGLVPSSFGLASQVVHL
jgi:hypothetical protein